LQDRSPADETGGINLPVKTTASDPAEPAESLLYVNAAENKLRVFAGAWRTLQSTARNILVSSRRMHR
jgi:hypothetical protein